MREPTREEVVEAVYEKLDLMDYGRLSGSLRYALSAVFSLSVDNFLEKHKDEILAAIKGETNGK